TLVLDVNAPAVQEGYHARWFRPAPGPAREEPEVWSAEIPLCAAGQAVGRITLSGPRDGEAVWRNVAGLAEIAEQIEAVLEPRLAAPAAAPWLEPAGGLSPVHGE